MSEITHDEAAELLGAYALHAVDLHERSLVEAHLAECPRCRAELRDHEAVAGLLGNSGGDAPDGLWDRIADALEETAPPMRLDLPTGQGAVIPLARRARRGVTWLAAAAAALVIAALGAQVLRQDDRIDELEVALTDQALLRAASAALADPDATGGVLRSPDGAVTATAVVLPDGTGYLMLDDVPDLGADRTYQLWGQSGSELISLGLLGARPDDVVPFHASEDVAALAITEEDAPGVVRSENPPALAGRLT